MENQTTQQQEKTKKDSFILPAVILLACLILGGFYYATQVSKQKSIENQQVLEREAEAEKIASEEREKKVLAQKELHERALKAASEAYIYVFSENKKGQQNFLDKFSEGTGDLNVALNNLLEEFKIDPSYMAKSEVIVEKIKDEKNAPKIYTQQASEPAYIPPVSNSINCTTHKIFDTTYTRCY